MRRLVIGGALIVLGALAACGGGSSSSSSGNNGGGAGSTGGASFATGSTSLGTVLTSNDGFTLYYFTPEKGGVIACTGTCPATWPPLKVTGTPSAPSGASGMLGTVTLSDGSMELTYNGWPLHTYHGDTAAGQTNGQGILSEWFAATPGLTSSGGASSGGASSSSTSSSGGY